MQQTMARSRGFAGDVLVGAIAVVGLLVVAILLTDSCSSSDSEYDKRPPVTDAIHVSLRDAFLSDGAVLQLKNTSDAQVNDVYIRFVNLDNKQEADYVVDIAPGQQVEVGVLECGWSVDPGDVISLHAFDSGYKMVQFRTYEADDGSVGIREKRSYEFLK